MIARATDILAEERAVDAPPDYSDTLMEQIQTAIERRKELQEKVDRSRALKEKAGHHVKQYVLAAFDTARLRLYTCY
jgi:hypothetical protein